MKGPIARLLIVVLNIPYWFGSVFGLALPFIAGWIALDADSENLAVYSSWFAGLYLAYWLAYWVIVLGVRLLQYIFLGSAKPADLLIEAKMDSEEFQELLAREGYTRETAREELSSTLQEQSKFMTKAGWVMIGIYFTIGFAVVFFVSR